MWNPEKQKQLSYLGIEPEGESRTSYDFDSTILIDNNNPTMNITIGGGNENDDDTNEIVIGGCDRKSVQFSIASRESIYDNWKERFRDQDVEIVVRTKLLGY